MVPKNETATQPLKTQEARRMALVKRWKKLEKEGIIFFNEDEEMCVTPGVIPAETVVREINEDIHHLD